MLTLYRRHKVEEGHGPACKYAGNPYWKKCTCPMWIRGTADGLPVKASLKTRSWEKAERLKEAMERGEPLEPAQNDPIAIDHAVEQYLLDAKERNLAEATLYKLTIHLAKRRPAPAPNEERSMSLLEFADHKGFKWLRQFDLAALREWRSTWTDKPLAKSKKQNRTIGFFYFCVRSGWLVMNPAVGLGKILVKQTPTSYFTRAEFDKLLDATHLYRDTTALLLSGNGGKRLRALVLLMRYSGLRVRDAVTISRPRINARGEVFLYQAKTGVPVFVPLPPQVLQALEECSSVSPNPNYYFWTGNGKPKSAVADWQRSFRRLVALADIREMDGSPKRCHPHMLRDTFAVELLLAGRPIEEVSMLLGHESIKTTEKSYAPWVAERQRKLAEGVRSTWGPNVVEIASKRKSR